MGAFYFGLAIGALIRTAIILIIFGVIIKLISRPISRKTSTIIGICFGVVVTVIPIIVSVSTIGDVLINVVFGALTGFGAYKISYSITKKNQSE
jgi:hypothetical protein